VLVLPLDVVQGNDPSITDERMTMSESAEQGQLLELTAQIVSAHVGHNEVAQDTLPTLIRSVYATLAGTQKPSAEVAEKPQPAVPVKKSVFPDFIICLEDGKKLKMLKRHLHTRYGLTPAQYREKWGLPHDYPMVAPSYAAHRSTLAKTSGLGRTSKAAAAAPISVPRKAGRPRKAVAAG
jgi:predicted transcriptional regulator